MDVRSSPRLAAWVTSRSGRRATTGAGPPAASGKPLPGCRLARRRISFERNHRGTQLRQVRRADRRRPATGTATVHCGTGRPAAAYAALSASRGSSRCASLTRVTPASAPSSRASSEPLSCRDHGPCPLSLSATIYTGHCRSRCTIFERRDISHSAPARLSAYCLAPSASARTSWRGPATVRTTSPRPPTGANRC